MLICILHWDLFTSKSVLCSAICIQWPSIIAIAQGRLTSLEICSNIIYFEQSKEVIVLHRVLNYLTKWVLWSDLDLLIFTFCTLGFDPSCHHVTVFRRKSWLSKGSGKMSDKSISYISYLLDVKVGTSSFLSIFVEVNVIQHTHDTQQRAFLSLCRQVFLSFLLS